MKTVAVLPLKRFGEAKQRLARDDRAELMRSMAGDVLAQLANARLAHIIVVTGDLRAAAMAAEARAEVVDEPGLLGHSAAAALGVRRAVELGAERALLVAGDCPLLTTADVDDLLAAHEGPGVVVLADRHGTGTNGLLLTPPGAIAPSFGPGSCARHTDLAAAAGVACTVEHVPGFALDVDTAEDLAVARAA